MDKFKNKRIFMYFSQMFGRKRKKKCCADCLYFWQLRGREYGFCDRDPGELVRRGCWPKYVARRTACKHFVAPLTGAMLHKVCTSTSLEPSL